MLAVHNAAAGDGDVAPSQLAGSDVEHASAGENDGGQSTTSSELARFSRVPPSRVTT